MFEGITRIDNLDGIYVKREDLAHWCSLDHPSGSKVRQYEQMINNNFCEGSGTVPPMIVGCSANSCQQIYIASSAHSRMLKGIIYVPKRAIRTSATRYCEMMGSEINEIKPGYLSVVRKHTRQRVIDLGKVIEWDRRLAILDTAAQCANIPKDIKQIIVPTGSGLTAAGVMIGVAGTEIEVIAIGTSPMILGSGIESLAAKFNQDKSKVLGPVTFIPPTIPYDKHMIEWLPDGTPLDPFYGAKAWHIAKEGQLFWPPGLRPVCSMPKDCQDSFRDWKGPQ